MIKTMTQEEKDLLLKDLCARLPYGIFCEGITMDIDIYTDKYYDHKVKGVLSNIHNYNSICYATIGLMNECELETIKPYLFPLSSMTEKQKSYLYFNTKFEVDVFGTLVVKMDSDDNYLYTDISDYTSIINWLIENKFDIYGLIPMGLAIDATGLNIY